MIDLVKSDLYRSPMNMRPAIPGAIWGLLEGDPRDAKNNIRRIRGKEK